jgi:Ca2+-binding EF-hand superfamily protein
MTLRVTVLIAALILSIVPIAMADEKKDHICFRVLDTNKDGLVTLQEFEKFYTDSQEQFNMADVDKDGNLTHEEYHEILGHGSS